MMNDLDKLALKYSTDKWGKHHYTPFYYDLFKDRRNEVKKVLEIGTAEGQSLFMWRDFFPKAQIYGAEIEQKRVDMMAGQNRIEVFKCDQSTAHDLIDLINKIGSDINLVVDDGSHIPDHQIFSCLTLMPLLKKEVVYIVEDVADEKIAENFGDYNYKILKVGKRYDDRLVIVKHR